MFVKKVGRNKLESCFLIVDLGKVLGRRPHTVDASD
jgi:hypothetical protein